MIKLNPTHLFEDDVIEYFNKYWDEYCVTDRLLSEKVYHKLHNVHRLYPYTAHREFFDKVKYIEQVSSYKLEACYMLEYGKGSFADMHHDHNSALTTVTVLYKSDDLIGGELIISDDDTDISFNMDHKVGETYFYDQTMKHGVSEVIKGTRRVLITWMKER